MIPRTLHFIWIAMGETLNELQRLCLYSAVLHTNCKVVLHTDDPTIRLKGIETRLRTFPTQIKGHSVQEDIPQGKRISHLKDIVRLEILHEEGGIYSDLDCIWLKDPWPLLDCKVAIGYTNKGYRVLCNAVILSEAKQPALLEYRDWILDTWPPKKYWTPANPYKLWEKREEVKLLDRYLFFPRTYKDTSEIHFADVEKSFCIHLYMSFKNPVAGSLLDLIRTEVEMYLMDFPTQE